MTTNAQMAAQMLRQTADFYRAIGETNDQYKEQMDDFAAACHHIAEQVEADPLGDFGKPAAPQ